MHRSALSSVAVFILVSLTGPAAATPPDMVGVRDELFGASPGEVFLLRTVTDNLGSHANALGTVFLVGIDVATGEEMLWPVHRARLQPGDRPESGGAPMEILTERLSGARNPFDVLAERRAVPSGTLSSFARPTPEPVELTAEGVAIHHPDGLRYAMSAARLFAGLKGLTAALATRLEPYGRLGPLGISDLLEGHDFSAKDCTAGEALLIRFPADVAPLQLARINCGELENGMALSALRVVPRVRP